VLEALLFSVSFSKKEIAFIGIARNQTGKNA
jgi:hypothetical protein